MRKRHFQSGYGFAVLVLASFVLTACSSTGNSRSTAETTPAPASPTAGKPPATAAAENTTTATALPRATITATATLEPGTYRNPVYANDFPDPDILQVGDTFFAYSTNSNDIHIPVIRSTDLVNWEYVGDAMPVLPEWAVQDFGWTWAPDVAVPANGEGYILYFTTRKAIEQGGVQCIGVATADTPEGPFKPVGDSPLICPTGEGGAIDAASFIDEDGIPYLLWKNDGNSTGGISWIHIQPVSEDGLRLEGERTRLIHADQIWEGVLVEGPTLWKRDGRYYLFYSANDYASPRYAAGYAVSDSILGPYAKGSEPVLASNLKAGIVGPGGQDLVTDARGQTWMFFHGWNAEGIRWLNLARLDWEGEEPVVAGLSRDPQPAPVVAE